MCIIVYELPSTSTTESIHNHPSQTPQMLGRKEIYTMQIVFLLDFVKHICYFTSYKNIFSQIARTQPADVI